METVGNDPGVPQVRVSAAWPVEDAGRPLAHGQVGKGLAFFTGVPAVVVVLAGFYALMLASLADKCVTFDETAHLPAGYAYWRFNDYRLNPENGVLPQRLAGLPAAVCRDDLIDRSNFFWRDSDHWAVGHGFIYGPGRRTESIILQARMAMGMLAVALGAIIYAWSRRLFGRVGGMLSLLLYVLCPAVLANGVLMTSDMAGALFFLASAWCFWTMLHKLTPLTALAGAATIGALLLSKMSGVLMVPLAAVMLIIRLAAGRPLHAGWVRTRPVVSRFKQTALLGGAIVAQAAVVYLMIWACYGFRYSILNQPQPDSDRLLLSWEDIAIPPGATADMIQAARDRRLLPEAYLYGATHILHHAGNRNSFLDGQWRRTGWKSFFPYTFLVKTPLPLMAVTVMALLACLTKLFQQSRQAGLGDGPAAGFFHSVWAGLYRTLPLWLLMAGYWLMVIFSNLNIGHRHLLPAYAPMLVLAGAAAYWLASKARWPKALLAAMVVLLAFEIGWRFPDYIAYFNQIVGGPRQGYRHLVDSSLDWGQDLPALGAYLDARGRRSDTRPVYLSYFGTADIQYYGIRAKMLPSFLESLSSPAKLEAGTYCISATMLQTVGASFFGPWNEHYERLYQMAREDMRLLRAADTPAKKEELLLRQDMRHWKRLPRFYTDLRFCRLCAYLRTRRPDDMVNYTFLVYELTDEMLNQAVEGPPAELEKAPADMP